MKKSAENRRFQRSRAYRTQKLQLTQRNADGSVEECEAKLWDFSEGGLGMDSPRAFDTGTVLTLNAKLLGPAYSIALDARARVVYCRKTDAKSYRVGLAFIDVAYRPIAEPDEAGGR